MAMTYKPQTRKLAISAWTDSGWMSGTVDVPPRRPLCESLNQTHGLICLEDAWLQDKEVRLRFLGLRSSGVHVIIPEHRDEMAETSGAFVKAAPRKVVGLLGRASVSGHVMVPQNLRVSDFFGRQRGFVAFSRATLKLSDAAGQEILSKAFGEVLVNCERLAGVASDEGW